MYKTTPQDAHVVKEYIASLDEPFAPGTLTSLATGFVGNYFVPGPVK